MPTGMCSERRLIVPGREDALGKMVNCRRDGVERE